MISRTIKKLHTKLKSKTLTVENLVKQCLEEIKALQDLNAFISLNHNVVNEAQISSQLILKGEPRSLLEGVPIAVKDNYCIKNIPTTCGSKMLENFKPTYTATVIEKLLNSGAILIGKTNMDEFAMGSGTVNSINGPTKNIWGSQYSRMSLKKSDDDKDWFICGGSSGGSAVAVASGVCLGAIGSDTGGSVRNPASYCGIVGLKPTYGLLSRHGLIPLVNSMDVPGILTLNVEDAAILLGIMAGHDVKDPTTVNEPVDLNVNFAALSVKGLKIGMPAEFNCDGLSDEMKSAWNDVAQILVSGGATIVTVSLPHMKYSNACYSILNQAEVASNMAKYDGVEFGHRSNTAVSAEQMFADSRSTGFNEVVRSRIIAGNYFLLSRNYDAYFVKALKVRRLICEDFKKVWHNGVNLLLTPTTLTDAPKYSEYIKKNKGEQSAAQDYCTQPANIAGVPAISIPVELSKKGLPISLQLMAPNFQEKCLLEVARYVENVVNFQQYR